MKASQLRAFEEAGIIGAVSLVGGNDLLEVDNNGLLSIPSGVIPKGFHLIVAVKKDSMKFVVQKDVGTEGGEYNNRALSELEKFARGFKAVVMRDPIDVIRAGSNTWTGWHKNVASNRVDCWHLGKNGELDLFQVGVITHDDGVTWYLHGEYRWRGQLYQMNGELVGRPSGYKWGSLEGGSSKRTQIFNHPEFSAMLDGIKRLPTWDGDESELDPPLPMPSLNQAVVDWYITFAGQSGQGIVKDKDGNSAWVHGVDIEGFDPKSFDPLLWHGDIVSYTGFQEVWGSKKNGPPKLTGVRLVSRAS